MTMRIEWIRERNHPQCDLPSSVQSNHSAVGGVQTQGLNLMGLDFRGRQSCSTGFPHGL